MNSGGDGNILSQLISAGMGYFWFILLAMWGGTANYISRVKKENMKFSLIELIGEWSISGFAGVLTALVCQEMQFSTLMTAALVGIAGHAGGRAIYIFEELFKGKFGSGK